MEKTLSKKKIAIVIAFQNFRDEEFFIPYEYFNEKGILVEVFSTQKGTAHGSLGKTFDVFKTVEELDEKNFDAIMFVGGGGTPSVRKSDVAIKLVKDFFKANKTIGAICWAPTILAKAGILSGKKATVWDGDDFEYKMLTSKFLEKSGAFYTGENVTADGKIITADGPKSAKKFAEAIEKTILQ